MFFFLVQANLQELNIYFCASQALVLVLVPLMFHTGTYLIYQNFMTEYYSET